MAIRSTRIRIAAALIGLGALGAAWGTSPAQASTVGGITIVTLPKVVNLRVVSVSVQTGIAGPRPTVTSTTAPGAVEVPTLISHEMIQVCATVTNAGALGASSVTLNLGTRGPAFTSLARPINFGPVPAGFTSTACTQMIMGDYDWLAGCPAYQKPTPWDFDVSVPVRPGSTSVSHAYSYDFAIWGGCNDPSYR